MNNKNQHIPQGYKNSPLGIIPEDWEVKRIGDFGKVITGNTPPTEDDTNYGNTYKFVSPADISDGKYIEITEKHLSEKGFSISRQMPKGTVLFTCIGSTIGKCAIANESLTSNQQINAIICNLKHSGEFLYYELSHRSNRIKRIAGEQAVPIINKSTFENYKVLCPPFEEQKGIAEILSLWDTAISKQTALIEKLAVRKKGLIQQLLTGKKRLKGFSGKWNFHRIEEHFELILDKNDGKGHTPMTISAKHGLISQKNKFDRIVAGNSLDKYILLKKGDFAYNKGNSNLYEMGCIYRLEEYSAVVPFVYICFRTKDNTCCEFYQHFFINHGLDHQLKKIITSGARGDGLLNVNDKDFMMLKIPYPQVEEQCAIATILDDADKEIEIQKQKLTSLQEQKKGLMQVLLTGKRRVK